MMTATSGPRFRISDFGSRILETLRAAESATFLGNALASFYEIGLFKFGNPKSEISNPQLHSGTLVE